MITLRVGCDVHISCTAMFMNPKLDSRWVRVSGFGFEYL